MKKIIIFLVLFISMITVVNAENYELILPRFEFEINGELINNVEREYPFLMYNHMVYIPLTWYDSHHFGFRTDFENNTLYLTTDEVTSSYRGGHTTENKGYFNCELSPHKVIINGQEVTSYVYPVLLYKGVNYIPVLADNMELLGLEYNLTDNKIILNTKNTLPKTIDLHQDIMENNIYLFEDHYYFVETVGAENIIKKTLANGFEESEELYRYEYSTSYGKNTTANFKEIGDDLWVYYHLGGAIMGSDVYINLTGDFTQIKGYNNILPYGSKYIIVDYSVPPSNDNLNWAKDEKRKIGIENYIYGWYVDDINGKTPAWVHGNSGRIKGDHLFIIGSDTNKFKPSFNGLHKINLKTNEDIVLIDRIIANIEYGDDYIYFYDSTEHKFYRCDYNGENLEAIYDKKLEASESMIVLDGQLILKDYVGYHLFEISIVNGKTYENVFNYYVYDDHLILEFKEEDYGVVVLDCQGQEMLKITDEIECFYGSDQGLLFKNDLGQLLRVDF